MMLLEICTSYMLPTMQHATGHACPVSAQNLYIFSFICPDFTKIFCLLSTSWHVCAQILDTNSLSVCLSVWLLQRHHTRSLFWSSSTCHDKLLHICQGSRSFVHGSMPCLLYTIAFSQQRTCVVTQSRLHQKDDLPSQWHFEWAASCFCHNCCG